MDLKIQQPNNMDLKSTSFGQNDGIFPTSPLYTLTDLQTIARLTQKMEQSLKVTSTPSAAAPSSDKYTIELITEKDHENVLTHLKKFFFKDEPLNTYIELGECKELEEYALKNVKDKCSYMAVTPTGEVIGVLLNGILKKPQPNAECIPSADSCKHPKFKKILTLMDYIDSQFNIFTLYPQYEKILDAKILSVDTNYRGMGIAGNLIEKSYDYMSKNSITVMHSLCSSEFSARLFLKLGFHQVYQLNYDDFKVDDVVLLKPEKPHVAAKIVCKEMN